jgi:hypothetical protein
MDRRACLTDSYAFRYISSYFTLRQSRSTNPLPRQLPLPCIDNRMPFASTVSVNASLMNWAAPVGVDNFRLPSDARQMQPMRSAKKAVGPNPERTGAAGRLPKS